MGREGLGESLIDAIVNLREHVGGVDHSPVPRHEMVSADAAGGLATIGRHSYVTVSPSCAPVKNDIPDPLTTTRALSTGGIAPQ